MPEPLDDACCASLPADALPLLGDLRAHAGVRVKLDGERAWLFWTAGDGAVLRRVLPAPGTEVYARRGEFWFRLGRSMPAFGVPDERGTKPLAEVVVPEPVRPLTEERPAFERVRLTLARDGRPRPATAILCRLEDLARWADGVPVTRLASLEAARCDGLALVRGEKLPELPDAERFWGATILAPLGCRPEPALSERELGRALGLGDGEIALLTAEGAEVIAGSVFRPVARAGLRLALREGA